MNSQFGFASEFNHERLSELFTLCFANYFVPIHVNAAAVANMVRRDSVDLARSPVIVSGGQPIGFAFVALRGSAARIAAMGVTPETRRMGVARRLMEQSLNIAQSQGCTEVVLEVITANEPAVKLYESMGFRRLNRLQGFTRVDEISAADEQPTSASSESLTKTDAATVSAWIAEHGECDLPWQLDARTICTPLSGCAAFVWKQSAACLISNPAESRVAVLSLVVHRDKRRAGIGTKVINELFRSFRGRTWRVPELAPEGQVTSFFLARGWQASAIQQYQMAKQL